MRKGGAEVEAGAVWGGPPRAPETFSPIRQDVPFSGHWHLPGLPAVTSRLALESGDTERLPRDPPGERPGLRVQGSTVTMLVLGRLTSQGRLVLTGAEQETLCSTLLHLL